MTLFYQVVEPGQYIRDTDPEYATKWSALPMHDDGKEGDAVAGDRIYTVQAPASCSGIGD